MVAAPSATAEATPAERRPGTPTPVRLALGGVVCIAFVLNCWALSRNGLGNTYYSAATRSMTASWRNFFFASFDPGGFITVDKPPVALWFQALSVRTFGYSSWTLLLPGALAGTASVAILFSIMRRHFGAVAATIAALVLAVSPVSVSVNRLNLPEPFMILFLVAAAWAVLRSLDAARPLVWLAVAGGFAGLAFNTKTLAAAIAFPALGLAVLVGARTWKSRVIRGAVLAGVAAVASLWWVLVVDVIPTSMRPYVGGSRNNTELNLLIGYNGLGRVDGEGQLGAGGRVRGLGSAGGIFGGQPGKLRREVGPRLAAVPRHLDRAVVRAAVQHARVERRFTERRDRVQLDDLFRSEQVSESGQQLLAPAVGHVRVECRPVRVHPLDRDACGLLS